MKQGLRIVFVLTQEKGAKEHWDENAMWKGLCGNKGKVFGTSIKTIWEEQLVDPLIHYFLRASGNACALKQGCHKIYIAPDIVLCFFGHKSDWKAKRSRPLEESWLCTSYV